VLAGWNNLLDNFLSASCIVVQQIRPQHLYNYIKALQLWELSFGPVLLEIVIQWPMFCMENLKNTFFFSRRSKTTSCAYLTPLQVLYHILNTLELLPNYSFSRTDQPGQLGPKGEKDVKYTSSVRHRYNWYSRVEDKGADVCWSNANLGSVWEL
jgi:hypothetical protein